MESPAKSLCVFALFLFAGLALHQLKAADGAGECGKVPADRMAFKLAPCMWVSQNPEDQVSADCCSAVHKLGQSPSCLCAVMLSNTARNAGVKPEVAITIPKRCNLSDRPIGYKCGGYTLP